MTKEINKSGDEPVRAALLREGTSLTLGDRNNSYGEPVGNMQNIGALWSTYLIGKYRGQTIDELNMELSGEDVAHMLTLMKITRTYVHGVQPDSYIDAAVYQAIAGECAVEESQYV